MDASLALTSLLMGLAGGVHCLAMCGPICAALGRSGGVVSVVPVRRISRASLHASSLMVFQLGRLTAYSVLGAAVAGSVQALGWLSAQSALLRPVWTFLHVGAVVLGGLLLWHGRQPVWLDEAARRVWMRARRIAGASSGPSDRPAAWVLGLGLAFLPCSLLYSALMVAALSSGMVAGALSMALFALGSGLSLFLGPWLWWRGGGACTRWAVRLAGGALLAWSLRALWLALVHDRAPWCLSPAGA